jgi:hypothetical protein
LNAAHEAGDQSPLRDHVDHRELFSQPDRVLGQRQRVTKQHDLDPLRHAGQDRREDVRLRLHAERRVMVLVQHDPVDAHLFGVQVLVQPLVVEPAALDRVEMTVGEHQRRVPERLPLVSRVRRHRLLGEVHQVHRGLPL